MKNINVVLEGDYKGKEIFYSSNLKVVKIIGGPSFETFNIASYTVIDETNKDQYSFWKGALGVALLGGLGAIAGVRGKKRTEYLIAINWKYGEKSSSIFRSVPANILFSGRNSPMVFMTSSITFNFPNI